MQALEVAPPVPGRFEQLTFDDGTTVIVDYAHTPDALENMLKAIRTTKKPDAALWCVFGCGGDRDASKRRVMGSIAERHADHVIVTSDNPRTEEPAAIMNDIRRGMNRPNDADWVVDRDAAIRAAAMQAAPGDVVLIAGKGHEPYQVIGTERRPFDDRKKARRYFSDRS
jgi:UDP-N-acetylmuramoyl-L-alanyl-D-glutamate--2,6-diaminopimelate ligase